KNPVNYTMREHVWEKKGEIPANCTSNAINQMVCTVCLSQVNVPVENTALGHKETVDVGTPATCTGKGKTEGKHCSVCGEVLVAQTEIPALGHEYADEFECHDRQCNRCDFVCEATKEHSFNDGEITKKPTTKEQGEKTFTCTACGETKVEPVAKLDNNGAVIGIIVGVCVVLAAGVVIVVIVLRRKKK
ncbi:MAG: hypothetical protein ACI4SC_04990, partial [Candidatus Neoclostridium sp.]